MSSDIELVQSSFEKVVPIADQAADLFYNRLFEIAPDVKPLFGESDMKAQGKKLMATLGVAVRGLSDLEATVPVIQKLAQNHVQHVALEFQEWNLFSRHSGIRYRRCAHG